jgi:hypothetical protein
MEGEGGKGSRPYTEVTEADAEGTEEGGRRKREEGRGKREEGRGKREEGRGKRGQLNREERDDEKRSYTEWGMGIAFGGRAQSRDRRDAAESGATLRGLVSRPLQRPCSLVG